MEIDGCKHSKPIDFLDLFRDTVRQILGTCFRIFQTYSWSREMEQYSPKVSGTKHAGTVHLCSPYFRLFWRWAFPYAVSPHSLYDGEDNSILGTNDMFGELWFQISHPLGIPHPEFRFKHHPYITPHTHTHTRLKK